MKILIYDTTAGGLSRVWQAGSFVGNFDYILPADSWEDVYAFFRSPSFPTVIEIEQIQFWGHGQQGRPLIGDKTVDLNRLGAALGSKINSDTIIWWRCCDVAEGVRGHQFMGDCTEILLCNVLAHCEVISWPNILWQKQICGLRPGQKPWWSLSGDELSGCSALRMNPPKWAFKD